MRQAIAKRKLALMAAEIFVPVNYSGFVHSGTDRMRARPFFVWQLEEFGGLEKVQIVLNSALERVVRP
jgi:hypothetical protein